MCRDFPAGEKLWRRVCLNCVLPERKTLWPRIWRFRIHKLLFRLFFESWKYITSGSSLWDDGSPDAWYDNSENLPNSMKRLLKVEKLYHGCSGKGDFRQTRRACGSTGFVPCPQTSGKMSSSTSLPTTSYTWAYSKWKQMNKKIATNHQLFPAFSLTLARRLWRSLKSLSNILTTVSTFSPG